MKLQLAFLAASAAICQANFDDDISYSVRDSDPYASQAYGLLKPVVAKMAERVTLRVTAVNNLHDAVLAADTTDFDKWPLCCDMEALTNIFDSNYGCPVDSTLACRRGPCTWGSKDTNRTADMPSTLGGKPACGNSVPGLAFYNACRKNFLYYDNTSFQYWGSEAGLFLEYPGSGIGKKQVSKPCSSDKYDCRDRRWYLEAHQALGSTRQSSVQFSSPYFSDLNGKVLMATASRSVSTEASLWTEEYFQGVVGMDMDIAYLMEPLADLDDAHNDFCPFGHPIFILLEFLTGINTRTDCMYENYSFMIDGNNGEIMAHPKLREIPYFNETGKNVNYDEVEPEMEIQHAIADILGKETGMFKFWLTRYKTYRNEIIESEEVESAAGFFDASYIKEDIQISCVNLETSGAALKYTVCAVFSYGHENLLLTVPIFPILIIAFLLWQWYIGGFDRFSESGISGSESDQ